MSDASPTSPVIVLLVEDEDSVRALAALGLRMYGYTVHEASNGPQALALSERYDGPIDLLVTDVLMPGMTGRELADRLLARRPGMRVLYISGYTRSALGGEVEEGPTLLAKPFTPAVLAARVREVLGQPADRAS